MSSSSSTSRASRPGVFEDVLHERGAQLHRVELDEGEPLPDWREFDAIVAMGGPMSVNDDADQPWLTAEKAARRRGRSRGNAVLGRVSRRPAPRRVARSARYPGPEPEVGLLPVSMTGEAARIPCSARRRTSS